MLNLQFKKKPIHDPLETQTIDPHSGSQRKNHAVAIVDLCVITGLIKQISLSELAEFAQSNTEATLSDNPKNSLSKAGNTLMTSPRSGVSMGVDDHPLSGGAHAQLPL
ncbi:hypothetical protein EVAR_35556_1 [Eumeta japonica]|uniref:Uncharacterized protein n=1 Tax=Eumeta variegata TaxID=151549 RepID=A0A4C1XPI7_EUMVA|nr:hypothetical protein EVAR_35556_1 [Eumeta japonica]